jgi:hypothetical protein
MSDTPLHDREIVATDEMIRNLRAGTFKKIAIGTGVCGALLFCGAALLVWTWKHGNDPEALKEALRHMPPLQVSVKLDPNSTVKLADGATVTIANPPVFNQAQTNGGGSSNNDPAIATTVTVFKSVRHGDGMIYTGWDFPNGAATTPNRQFCYYNQQLGGGNEASQTVGWNGAIAPTPTGVRDQDERFAKCRWWNGSVG